MPSDRFASSRLVGLCARDSTTDYLFRLIGCIQCILKDQARDLSRAGRLVAACELSGQRGEISNRILLLKLLQLLLGLVTESCVWALRVLEQFCDLNSHPEPSRLVCCSLPTGPATDWTHKLRAGWHRCRSSLINAIDLCMNHRNKTAFKRVRRSLALTTKDERLCILQCTDCVNIAATAFSYLEGNLRMEPLPAFVLKAQLRGHEEDVRALQPAMCSSLRVLAYACLPGSPTGVQA